MLNLMEQVTGMLLIASNPIYATLFSAIWFCGYPDHHRDLNGAGDVSRKGAKKAKALTGMFLSFAPLISLRGCVKHLHKEICRNSICK